MSAGLLFTWIIVAVVALLVACSILVARITSAIEEEDA